MDDKVHFSSAVQLSSENPTYRYLTLNTVLYKEGYVKLDVPINTDGHVYKVTILGSRNAYEIRLHVNTDSTSSFYKTKATTCTSGAIVLGLNNKSN